MASDAVKIKQPFWDCALLRVAKEASENERNLTSAKGMDFDFDPSIFVHFGIMQTTYWHQEVLGWWALFNLACKKLRRAEISGLELVEAYCKLPTRPRKACRSSSETDSLHCFLRRRSILMGGMSSYFPWSISMEKSACWTMFQTRESHSLDLFTTKGKFWIPAEQWLRDI